MSQVYPFSFTRNDNLTANRYIHNHVKNNLIRFCQEWYNAVIALAPSLQNHYKMLSLLIELHTD